MNIKTLVTFIVVVVLLALGSGFAWFANQLRPVASDDTPAIPFEISQGEGVRTIAQHLKDAGLIRNPLAFSTYAKVEGIAASFQAGTYTLTPSDSSQEIARLLSEGEVTGTEVSIKILEGWSNKEIAEYLTARAVATDPERFGASQTNNTQGDGQDAFEDSFLAALNATDSRDVVPGVTYDFLADKPAGATLEGFLYPDTYRIYTTFTVSEIIQKMLDNFGEKIRPLATDISTGTRSLFEILTVASIIEREVLSSADMKNAADVFWKRLDIGMPLQSDATINYITGRGNTRPTFEELSVVSPYNTYQNPGLPPGPIGNPSIVAIEAALHPTPNDYYYFLTKEDGTAVFSRTLDEHNANKAKYLQ